MTVAPRGRMLRSMKSFDLHGKLLRTFLVSCPEDPLLADQEVRKGAHCNGDAIDQQIVHVAESDKELHQGQIAENGNAAVG